MPQLDIEKLVKEEVQRHKQEQLNEIFGWLKKLWQSITDSHWDIVNRASSDPESGLPKISRERWNKSPRWQKDAWVQIAKEWLDIPEDTKREMLYKSLSRRASLNKFRGDLDHHRYGRDSWDREYPRSYRGRYQPRLSDDDLIEWDEYLSSKKGRKDYE